MSESFASEFERLSEQMWWARGGGFHDSIYSISGRSLFWTWIEWITTEKQVNKFLPIDTTGTKNF